MLNLFNFFVFNMTLLSVSIIGSVQTELYNGDLFQRFFDSAPKSEAVIEPEIGKREMHIIDGEGCTCVEYDNLAPWSQWGQCDNANGHCHKASQQRLRMCISETENCYQLKRRSCYHADSCTGSWSKPITINSTCDEEVNCGVEGNTWMVKFCSLGGVIGAMCKGSSKEYKLVRRQCNIPCASNDSGDNAISTMLGLGKAYSINRQDRKSEWTTIFLGILAGVLLVALLSVSFSYWVSSRTQKLDFESSYYRPSNDVIGTSDTVLTVSTPITREKQIHSRKGAVGSTNQSTAASETPHSSNLGKKEIPLAKSNSFSMGNCAKPTEKCARDSLLSISKLIKHRQKNDTMRYSSPENELFIERINLQGDGEVIVTSHKPNCN